MAKLDLQLKDKVAVLTMSEDDNKLNLDMCNSLLSMLDRVERETEALTLVITSGHERIWSNGFDTNWIEARLAAGDKATVREFLSRDLELRRRLLVFPMVTIAAINGHVFGGGAVMSCCCDFRFMRTDRGFFCIPVVDRQFPILPGTAALLQNVMPFSVAEELVLTGRRFTGTECAASHIIAGAYPNNELMDRVMAFAAGLDKGRWIIGQMKQVKNGRVVKLMEEDLEYIEDGKVKV